MAESTESTGLKISYQSKESIVCPVCKAAFHREELLSGSGRLIAGSLTDELHRLYEPSAKFGDIYPLAYQATVCPACWFASMDADFTKLPENKCDEALEDEEKRKEEAAQIYLDVDFEKPRGLPAGIISQYLVLRCYDYYPAAISPTIKQGVAALRAGWMLDDLDKKEPGQNYDWLAVLFKKKARFFYSQALQKEQTGKETLSALANLGPDTDKNYGYEGLLYLTGLLEYKYGDTSDPERRRAAIDECKRTLAKMFGMGKSSKSKPGPLMEKSRELYDAFAKELNEFDE
ncbi:membrane protein [Spirochaetia bacterium]|nr:membrane protein [Spirochaetia bacterium]